MALTQEEKKERSKMRCKRWRENNREKYNLIRKSWRQKNPEKYKNSLLKTLYGFSTEQYNEMYADQNGCCAICRVHPDNTKLVIDHDHKTGEVRGLLCNKCNVALGMMNEDKEILISMLSYLTTLKQIQRELEQVGGV